MCTRQKFLSIITSRSSIPHSGKMIVRSLTGPTMKIRNKTMKRYQASNKGRVLTWKSNISRNIRGKLFGSDLENDFDPSQWRDDDSLSDWSDEDPEPRVGIRKQDTNNNTPWPLAVPMPKSITEDPNYDPVRVLFLPLSKILSIWFSTPTKMSLYLGICQDLQKSKLRWFNLCQPKK